VLGEPAEHVEGLVSGELGVLSLNVFARFHHSTVIGASDQLKLRHVAQCPESPCSVALKALPKDRHALNR
jgi:hypothetical protein